MDVTPVRRILDGECTGRKVRVRGWLHRHRSTGGLVFAIVRDATGIVQVAIKKGRVPDADFDAVETTSIEASLVVEGEVSEDRRAPGGYELRATSVRLHGPSTDFPIYRDQSPEHLLDVRHLWVRSQHISKALKLRAATIRAMREWFEGRGFTEVHPPLITGSACEGGATVFTFDYFGQEAYLTQSSQMYLETLVFGLENVYCLQPSFRAEKSRTTKHLTEFWHLEAEEAWVDNDGNMRLQEELVAHTAQRVAQLVPDVLRELGRDPAELDAIKAPFPRLHYDKAIDEIQAKGVDISWGDDFGVPHEQALTAELDTPLFVTHFPAKIKAFYMALDDDKVHAKCADLLAPKGFGEIIGGSERSEDIDLMTTRLVNEGADPKEYEWYLDLRRWGSVPHSGFGLGIERVVRWFGNIEHIRDTIPFPRTINRCRP